MIPITEVFSFKDNDACLCDRGCWGQPNIVASSLKEELISWFNNKFNTTHEFVVHYFSLRSVQRDRNTGTFYIIVVTNLFNIYRVSFDWNGSAKFNVDTMLENNTSIPDIFSALIKSQQSMPTLYSCTYELDVILKNIISWYKELSSCTKQLRSIVFRHTSPPPKPILKPIKPKCVLKDGKRM